MPDNQSHSRTTRTFIDLPDEPHSTKSKSTVFSRNVWAKGIGWEDLLNSKRILIVSEAGTGKTHECEAEQEARWNAGEPAFYFELAQISATAAMTDLMSPEELIRYEAWLKSQSDVAVFFFDSIDELNLTRGSFAIALKQISKSLAGQLGRAKIVITARPIPVDEQLVRKHLPIPLVEPACDDKSFADIMMKGRNSKAGDKSKEKEFRKVELLPLSDNQILELAALEGVENPAELFADIRQRKAEEFARRPQDLIELCADWRDHHRIRTHLDQVESNVQVKLKPRTNGSEKSELDFEKAHDGASRIALAMLMTRKLSIRFNAESDRKGVEAALDPAKILIEWPALDHQTLLERGLFGFAGYGRVRFHHRSVIEYLAAKQLDKLIRNGMSCKAVNRILFAQTPQKEKVIKPSMRPVAAWLALSNAFVFRQTLEREPEVLISFGDPEALSVDQRKSVLRAYFNRYCNGGWRGHNFERIQLCRFGCDGLSDEILQLLETESENGEVRQMLFELISAASIAGCADVAFKVALDPKSETGERIYAIESLINLNDGRVGKIVSAMVDTPSEWPDRLYLNAIIRLFPQLVDMTSLRELLKTRPESKRDRENVGDFFAAAIEDQNSDLSTEYLDELRATFTGLVSAGVERQDSWPHFLPKRKHLLEPLAAVCLRLLRARQLSDSLLESSIATLRFSEDSSTNEKPISELRKHFQTLSVPAKEKAFWIANELNLRFDSETSPRYQLTDIVHHCHIRLGVDDAHWVERELGNQERSTDQRALLLAVAANYTSGDGDNYQEYLISLQGKVKDCELLASRLEGRLKPREVDPDTREWEREQETNRQRKAREEQEAHASWVTFWQKVSSQPETVFDEDQRENTTWNLWDAMTRSGEKGRASGWNRRFIENYFGVETADRLRGSLMRVWREMKPTFRSERSSDEKSTYFTRWELGLAGIAAESEESNWAAKLNKYEVELALRHALVEFNGLPVWLPDLAAAHPTITEELLGNECLSELDESADANGHFFLLQKLRYANPELVKLFVPMLNRWFLANHARVRNGEITHKIISRLSDVREILISLGDGATHRGIREIAAGELSKEIDDAYVVFWLSTLVRLDPSAGTDQLELLLAKEAKADLVVKLFAQLFGNHGESSGFHLGIHKFSPFLLLRLVRLANTYIKRTDDNVHDGPYTPNPRDNAERGRGSLLNALLAQEGPDAWSAKVEMANDPLFSHFRERALDLAREKAAEELDREKLTEKEMVVLYKHSEAPPKTRETMFELLVDRLDDLDLLLLDEDSPRGAWQLIEEEKLMRQAIARELKNNANEAYVVGQESVTADEKEMDIRLRSTASPQQAVVELKLGNQPRSGKELRDTLKDQVVTKYMADENCKAGCLLITVAKKRRWQHPDTKKWLDPKGLERMLCEAAVKIEAEMGHSLRLTAKVIDLRPRLLTEKESAKN